VSDWKVYLWQIQLIQLFLFFIIFLNWLIYKARLFLLFDLFVLHISDEFCLYFSGYDQLLVYLFYAFVQFHLLVHYISGVESLYSFLKVVHFFLEILLLRNFYNTILYFSARAAFRVIWPFTCGWISSSLSNSNYLCAGVTLFSSDYPPPAAAT